MAINIIGLVILILLVILFAWLVTRAWRSRRAYLKWPGILLAGLLTIILLALTVTAAIGEVKLGVRYNRPVAELKAPNTPELIALGMRFANGCAGCHSSTGKLPLDGGKDNMLEGGPPLGVVYAPNLTPGGVIKDWSDGEVVRAIREGIDDKGRALMIMPSSNFRHLADADVEALLAYLRSQPAVQHDTPERNLNLIAAVLLGAGVFPTAAQPPLTEPAVAPPAGPTADYGQYLVSISGCRDCHGPALAGSPPGGLAPSGPNLTASVPRWSEADFFTTIRIGITPSGKKLSDEMPWDQFSAMFTDGDLKAIYAYVHGLTPQAGP